jgi:hypothetical protein
MMKGNDDSTHIALGDTTAPGSSRPRLWPAAVVVAAATLITMAAGASPTGAVAAAVSRTTGVSAAGTAAASSSSCPWLNQSLPVGQRVQMLMAQMTLANKINMMTGAGFNSQYVFEIPAIPSLCIPAIGEEDGPLGPGDSLTGVTQLPATASLAATFDPSLANQYGQVVGSEEHGKGAMVDLGPTVNIPPGTGPGFGDVISALHTARLGDPAHLNTLIAGLSQAGGSPADFSSGLHAATLCTDLRFSWGSDAVPVGLRTAPLERAAARLTVAQTWPFDARTAEGDGFVQTCLNWPVTLPAPEAGADSMLPRIPVLLLAGDHDLSTPLEWAQMETVRAPLGQLVIVKGAAHSIQNRELGTQGRDAVFAFLLSSPCQSPHRNMTYAHARPGS